MEGKTSSTEKWLVDQLGDDWLAGLDDDAFREVRGTALRLYAHMKRKLGAIQRENERRYQSTLANYVHGIES